MLERIGEYKCEECGQHDIARGDAAVQQYRCKQCHSLLKRQVRWNQVDTHEESTIPVSLLRNGMLVVLNQEVYEVLEVKPTDKAFTMLQVNLKGFGGRKYKRNEFVCVIDYFE